MTFIFSGSVWQAARFAPVVGLLLIPSAAVAQKPAKAADLIVTSRHIYTVDSAGPRAEAFAVRDGRFVFVGSRSGAMALRGAGTRVLDLGDGTVVPGLTDAHAHLVELGFALQTVDLTGASSYAEVVRRVAARA